MTITVALVVQVIIAAMMFVSQKAVAAATVVPFEVSYGLSTALTFALTLHAYAENRRVVNGERLDLPENCSGGDWARLFNVLLATVVIQGGIPVLFHAGKEQLLSVIGLVGVIVGFVVFLLAFLAEGLVYTITTGDWGPLKSGVRQFK